MPRLPSRKAQLVFHLTDFSIYRNNTVLPLATSKGPSGKRERGSSRSQVTLVTEVTYSHLPHMAPEASKESKSRLGWIP